MLKVVLCFNIKNNRVLIYNKINFLFICILVEKDMFLDDLTDVRLYIS